MKIQVIKTIREFELLRDSWNRLLHESDRSVVYLTYEWFLSWWKSFGQDNQLHMVTVVDDSGDMTAIAPLMLSNSMYRNIPVRKLSFLANEHSPSVDFIIKRHCEAEAIEIIILYLETYLEWSMVELQKLDSSSDTFVFLTNYLNRSDRLSGLKDNIESPFIVIDSDWDKFLNKRSLKFRKVLRNKINRVNKSGDLSIERVLITGGSHSAIEKMFQVSGRSWKKKIGTDLLYNQKSQMFYKNIADHLGPQGIVSLWFLKKGDNPIAFEFHLNYNKTVYPIRADYDESFKELSPGSFLEYKILETVFKDGDITEYNSCGHTYGYLLNWTQDTRKHIDIELFSKTLRPYTLYALEYKLIPFLRRLRLNQVRHLWKHF